MKIGDRVELKIDGRQGKITGMDYDFESTAYTGRFIVLLDDLTEMVVMPLDIKRVYDKKKKQEELMKLVKKGG